MSVTLAEIERAVAQRCGKFKSLTASSATTAGAVVTSLASSIDQGADLIDLWILRRAGVAADRLRQVRDFAAASGTLYPDRFWGVAPAVGEAIELHYLHPTDELRAATLAGLRRCFFLDRVTVTPPATGSEFDLTALAPWITDESQVYELEYDYASSATPPRIVWWWRAFTKGAHVWLKVPAGVQMLTLLVTARRPHSSWVNGANSAAGPVADADTLDVALDYAAGAGQIELWRIAREKLQPGASVGLLPSQTEAAAEFTRAALTHFQPPSRRMMLSSPFGVSEVTP